MRDRKLNPEGHDLDIKRLGRTNWQIVKSPIDQKANAAVDRGTNERSELSQAEIDLITRAIVSLRDEGSS